MWENIFAYFCDIFDNRIASVVEKCNNGKLGKLSSFSVGQEATWSLFVFSLYISDINSMIKHNESDINFYCFEDDIMATVEGSTLNEGIEKAKHIVLNASIYLK